MRITRELREGWKQPVIEGGEKNYTLPLILPAGELPEKLTLTHELCIPADEKTASYFLETSFLSGRCAVFIDDTPVREYRSVFAPRRTDITAFITKGETQTLRFEITPTARADGNFTFGAASVTSLGRSHFAFCDEKEALTVRTAFGDAGVSVFVRAEIETPNNYDVLLLRLTSPGGTLLDVKSARPTAAAAVFELPAPELWEGLHANAYYRMEAVLQRDAEEIDRVEQRFAVRDFIPGDGGFFRLNGIKLPLNGAVLRGGGSENELQALAALDANLAGVTCLDVNEEALNRCDALGIFTFFLFPETGDEADFEELAALTRMLAKHPCCAFLAYKSRDPAYAKKFCATVKQNAQYIYTAGGTDILNGDALCDAIPDVLLLEYAVSPEKNGFTELDSRFAAVSEAHPEYRFAVLPQAPECIFDRHSVNAARPDCSQEYFSMWHARVWEIFSRRKNAVCYFTGYLTDETEKSGRTGLTDVSCTEQKDAFWFYKGRFSAGDFVKLASLPDTVTKKRRISNATRTPRRSRCT